MADIERRADERAQFLIITAVSFAVILIALALALNTAVYGNVHVSQTDSSSFEERGAMQYQDSAQRGIASLLPLIGEDETETELRQRLEAEVELWQNLTRTQYAGDGVATGLTVEAVTFQDRVVQDDKRTFENVTGSGEWTVAGNVSEATTFRMEVHNESLATDDNATFSLEVTGADGNTWSLSAGSTNESEIVIEVNGTEQYKTNESSLGIEVANGTFDDSGVQATFTSFVDDDTVSPPYELRYVNAENVTGTYVLVDDQLAVDESNYSDTDSPRVDPQIRATTITVAYQSPELTYRSEIRSLAGESDG